MVGRYRESLELVKSKRQTLSHRRLLGPRDWARCFAPHGPALAGFDAPCGCSASGAAKVLGPCVCVQVSTNLFVLRSQSSSRPLHEICKSSAVTPSSMC